MAQSYLMELIKIGVRIQELDVLEHQFVDKRDWEAAKEEYESRRAQFNKVRNTFVDNLLENTDSGEAVDSITAQLSELRERADPSWHAGIDYTSGNLVPYLEKQACRSPRMRKALKVAPFIAACLVIAAYFGFRLLSAVPVTHDIETREGIQQRAAAIEKALRYDDWMHTRVRRGG